MTSPGTESTDGVRAVTGTDVKLVGKASLRELIIKPAPFTGSCYNLFEFALKFISYTRQ